MTLEPGPAMPEAMQRYLAAVDQEFVFAKGRSLSLEQRFPGLMLRENVTLARDGGEVLAGAAARPFVFRHGAERLRCAAIGAVWTAPAHRGRGLASRVLRTREAAERSRGTELLVLWSSLHPVYESVGYRVADRSVIAKWRGAAHGPRAPGPNARRPHPLHDALATRVERDLLAWSATPLPAERVELLEAPGAYALLGLTGTTGYLYELVGEPCAFAPVWRETLARCQTLWVNDFSGSASQAWLESKAGLAFEPQRLTMIKPLTPRAAALASVLHVPYLDRV